MMNGLSAGEQIKKLLPRTKLIYLTMNHDVDTAAEAFRPRCSGFILKNAAGEGDALDDTAGGGKGSYHLPLS